METETTVQPPRTRLCKLKSSADFPSDEFNHSIKTWVNMASLLVKQVNKTNYDMGHTAEPIMQGGLGSMTAFLNHTFHWWHRGICRNQTMMTRTHIFRMCEHACKCVWPDDRSFSVRGAQRLKCTSRPLSALCTPRNNTCVTIGFLLPMYADMLSMCSRTRSESLPRSSHTRHYIRQWWTTLPASICVKRFSVSSHA